MSLRIPKAPPPDPSLEIDSGKVTSDTPSGPKMHSTPQMHGDSVATGPGPRNYEQQLGTGNATQVQPLLDVAPATQTPGTTEVHSLADAFDGLQSMGGPGQVRLLEGNLEAWASRWKMLEDADKTIDTTYFIIEKDPFGFAFLGHLLKKQREGVKVRLMVDAMADTFGKHGFKATFRGQDYMQELAEAGSAVKVYHPVTWRPLEIFSRDFLASNHDKLLVVDGDQSNTGGRNIAWDYFAHPDDFPTAWRDTDVQMQGRGPAAGLTRAFEAEFDNEKLTHKIGPDLLGNWRQRDIELIGAYLLMDTWIKAPALTEEQKTELRTNESAREAWAKDLVRDAVARLPAEGIEREPNSRELNMLTGLAQDLVAHTEHRGAYNDFDAGQETHAAKVKILDKTSTAGRHIDEINAALIELSEHAQKRIVIENPYVVLTETMIEALAAASKRGVEIVIGTNSPLSTDSATTQAFFLQDWPYIMARVPTLRIFVATGERKMHAKTAFIDDNLALVSTYNLDFLSAYVNGEVAAVMLSEGMAKDVMQSFIDDQNEPRNGVLEYKIQRDADGNAVLVDGKPVVEFGPSDHLPDGVLEDYSFRMKLANFIRKLPWFEPLRHPPLVDKP